MKLIVITPDSPADQETKIVNELLSAGLQRLHIRKPGYTRYELSDYIRAVDQQYHQYLVLHSHYDLYSKFQAGGIHLSSYDRNEAGIVQSTAHVPSSAISTSFHSWHEISENSFPYGYVFISPVFDSISKAGYTAGIDLAGALALKRAATHHLPDIIGLGGVAADKLTDLHQYGFDGAAMLGSIWMAKKPVAAFTEALNTAQSL